MRAGHETNSPPLFFVGTRGEPGNEARHAANIVLGVASGRNGKRERESAQKAARADETTTRRDLG